MGPRLGRVEYTLPPVRDRPAQASASMGPRLGRVEYRTGRVGENRASECFNGATLRTRGIRDQLGEIVSKLPRFNGATLRTRGIHSTRSDF